MESNMSAGFEVVVEREVNVPRARMYELWTDCAHLKHWFGPRGSTLQHCANDLRVGGRLHYMMTIGEAEIWGRWEYRQIDAPARLEYISAFSDKHGELARNPWSAKWPLETLSIVEFEDRGERTNVVIRWSAWNASAEEVAEFEANAEGMRGGLAGMFQNLEEYIAEQ